MEQNSIKDVRSRKTSSFIKPEGSLQFSQETAAIATLFNLVYSKSQSVNELPADSTTLVPLRGKSV